MQHVKELHNYNLANEIKKIAYFAAAKRSNCAMHTMFILHGLLQAFTRVHDCVRWSAFQKRQQHTCSMAMHKMCSNEAVFLSKVWTWSPFYRSVLLLCAWYQDSVNARRKLWIANDYKSLFLPACCWPILTIPGGAIHEKRNIHASSILSPNMKYSNTVVSNVWLIDWSSQLNTVCFRGNISWNLK